MAKKFNRDGSFFAGDAQHTGQEPTWEDYNSLTQDKKDKRLQDALYFYSYYCDFEDLKKDFKIYAMNYFPEKDIKYVLKWYKKASKTLFTSGKLARMVNRGMPENEANVTHFKQNFKDVLKACQICERYINVDTEFHETEKEKKKVISPTKRLENKCNEKVLCFLEETIDDIIELREYQEINIHDLLGLNAIPAKGCEYIMKSLHRELSFLQEVKEGKDTELLEAYDFLAKRDLNKVIKFIKDWICDIEKYRQSVKKATAKVRVVKHKPAAVQVEKLNYDRDNSTVSAVKIPGAVELILFNSKYRKLQVYYSIGRNGLSVKGTTIKDFDDVKSYQVTVRENLVEDVLSKDPKQVDKFFGPKTKRTKVNGRVNEHCRIVYVK